MENSAKLGGVVLGIVGDRLSHAITLVVTNFVAKGLLSSVALLITVGVGCEVTDCRIHVVVGISVPDSLYILLNYAVSEQLSSLWVLTVALLGLP